jgi:class 3 adenylate cyclase
MTIEAWLAGLGLGQYAESFAANAIDFDVLADLSESDLEKIGVLLGHRKKLLRAIRARAGAADPPPPPPGPAASTPAATPAPADAERRQITVLFSDLVGSTTLSQRIDPETLRDVLGAYQAMAVEAIRGADGMLAKFLGDGVLAYFGYPTANDDDAIRAVRAARAMIANMAGIDAHWRNALGGELEIRVGLHTGVVVVGDMGSGDARESNAIVGETPNLAARVQGIAEPGTVAISGATWRLVRRVFSCRPLGIQAAKGVAGGIEVFLVEGETAMDDAIEDADDMPLVGRTEEIGLLTQRFALARAGAGQAVLISGEAGLGKSRLVRAFRAAGDTDASQILAFRCAPEHRHSAFYPIIALLTSRFGFAADETSAMRREKLVAALDGLAIARPEISQPLVELLGLADAPGGSSEEQRQRRLMGALLQYVTAEARRRPHLLVVEDAHWLDQSTEQFLGVLLGALAELPLLVIVTFRPEFVPPWPVANHVTALALGRMTTGDLAVIAQSRAGKELPPSLLAELLSKSDGVPLFAEELTQSVIHSGAVIERGGRYELSSEMGAVAIPGTLRDSLTARLDRLHGARRVAQIGAVIGREFPYEMIAAAAELAPEELDRDLETLSRSDILRQRGLPPRATYIFKHALLQEAAYDTLLRGTRQQYHARIAAAYQKLLPEEAETYPEILAQHYASAGMDERAVDYYVRAADAAYRRAGLREAIAHFRAALERLMRLPEDMTRDRREVDILLKLGSLIGSIEGARAPAYLETYERAHALASRLGDDRLRFAAGWGLWFHEQIAGDLATIPVRRARVEEMFAVARKLNDADLELEAFHSRWATRFGSGELHGAKADTVEGIARYDRARHATNRFTYGGHDTGVCAYGHGGLCAAVEGDAESSAALLESGLSLAREIGDPPVLGHGFAFAGMGAQIRGDIALCQAIGEEAFAFSRRHTVAQFNVISLIVGSWGHYALGERERGRELSDAARLLLGSAGSANSSPLMNAMLADIDLAQGDPEGARKWLVDGRRFGNPIYECDLLRRLGELTLLTQPGKLEEAAQLFQSAIELSRRQGARLFELRAALALARLRGDEGRRAEAAGLLRPLVTRFADSVTMSDLAEARALLATLS